MSNPRPVALTTTAVNNNPLSIRVTDTSRGDDNPARRGSTVQAFGDASDPVMNPDLPTRDSLYIFVNFSSYTRTPKQGSQGVRDDQLKHASRLLDYARVRFRMLRLQDDTP